MIAGGTNLPMTGLVHPSIDDIDCEILAELQANARIAFAELGRRVGLSTPAVIERVHRLEESQVILGYRTLDRSGKGGASRARICSCTVAGDKLAEIRRRGTQPARGSGVPSGNRRRILYRPGRGPRRKAYGRSDRLDDALCLDQHFHGSGLSRALEQHPAGVALWEKTQAAQAQ